MAFADELIEVAVRAARAEAVTQQVTPDSPAAAGSRDPVMWASPGVLAARRVPSTTAPSSTASSPNPTRYTHGLRSPHLSTTATAVPLLTMPGWGCRPPDSTGQAAVGRVPGPAVEMTGNPPVGPVQAVLQQSPVRGGCVEVGWPT